MINPLDWSILNGSHQIMVFKIYKTNIKVLKSEIDKTVILVGDFYTHPSTADKTVDIKSPRI